MAAAPRPAATLLLLLLPLLQPRPASGNEGGAVSGCRCLRLRQPPRDPAALAQVVLSYQACPGHLIRFQLPHSQICGLKTAAWVIQLQELLEQKEAARIDASRGEKGRGPALKPANALLPPNANPPMLSTARPTVPQGPTDRPLAPHGPTDRPLAPHGPTDSTPEPHGPTDRPLELHGLTDGTPDPHGPTDGPLDPQGPTDGTPDPHGPTDGPLDPQGPTDGSWKLHGRTDGPPELHRPTARPTDGALPSNPAGGPSVALRQGEGAGDGAPPMQPGSPATAVLALLGIALGLVGAVTGLLCRRRRGGQCGGASRGPPQGPSTPHRDPGSGTLYHPCELG